MKGIYVPLEPKHIEMLGSLCSTISDKRFKAGNLKTASPAEAVRALLEHVFDKEHKTTVRDAVRRHNENGSGNSEG